MIYGDGIYSPIAYEIRMTASELGIIIKALKLYNTPTKEEKELLENYEKLYAILDVSSCRKYGYIDESRLNWK